MFSDPELTRSLAVEEYKSLRAESSAAKNNQQTVLQWSLAATGIIVAASIAVTRPVAGFEDSVSYNAVTLAFATVMPMLAGCAFGVWIGEVQRMEKVGRFLRMREQATWPGLPGSLTDAEAPGALPIMWESLIYSRKNQHVFGKNVFGSGAACLLFLGVYVLSLAVSVTLTWTAPISLPGGSAGRWTLTGWNVLIGVVGVGLFSHQLLALRKSSRESADDASSDEKQVADVEKDDEPIDVVLPCLNEELALPWVIDRFPAGFHPVVVDNGSSDGSVEIAEALGVTVIHAGRKGVGVASTSGIRQATSDVVCVIDCDGTVDPAHLPRLVKPIVDGQADLSVGSRQYRPGSTTWLRRLMFRGVGLLIRRRLRVRVTDLGSARAIRRAAFADVLELLDQRNGWSLDLLRVAAVRPDRIVDVPLPFLPRRGRSKITGTFTGAALTVYDVSRVLCRPVRVSPPTALDEPTAHPAQDQA